jgi:hypothetical protein
MSTNTSSTTSSPGRPGRLAALAAAVEELATQEPDGLPDAVRAEEVLVLRRLLDRLEGHWLHQLAAIDGRGPPVPSRDSRPVRLLAGCETACA